MTNLSPRPRWTREQIRAAHVASLVPLLQQRGLELIECEAGNYTLPAYPGLIVKDSYWRWPERDLAGNANDFHVQVLGLTFHDAMRQITGTLSVCGRHRHGFTACRLPIYRSNLFLDMAIAIHRITVP